MSDEYIIVGKLGRKRGLFGEIYVTPDTDFPDRFLDLPSIFVKRKNEWVQMEIAKATLISDRPVLKFKGVNTPEAAARLTNSDIAVLKTELVKLPEGSHYIFELIGCQLKDEATDEILGEIIDVEQYPANDVYLLKLPDETTVRFPAVKQFVKSIDIEDRQVIVDKSGLMS